MGMISKLNPLRHSLSTRLLSVFIIASVLLTGLAMYTLLHGFANQWRVNAQPHLQLYLDYISEDIGNPPSQARALELSQKLPVHIYIQGPDGQYSTNGETLSVDEMFFNKPGKNHRRRIERGPFTNIEFGGDEDRTLLKKDVGDYQVIYELSHRSDSAERQRFMLRSLVALLASLAALYFIIRRMLRPVNDIRKGVVQMGQGDLKHRIPVRSDNDLGALAGSINTMASDIENMLDSKRQLLLGASHELRSPLTRATIATQLLPESRCRAQIVDDLQEMEKLIANILESERMKSGHAVLDREQVDLEKLVKTVIVDMQAEDVTIIAPESLPAVPVDPTRLSILLRNIIGNAISHSADSNQPVTVFIKHIEDKVRVTVQDKGPGIAEHHLDKLTEPFYRTDESRTRQTGGFGLGLHLAKLIAEAHGGTLMIRSTTGVNPVSAELSSEQESSGTEVSVELPLSMN